MSKDTTDNTEVAVIITLVKELLITVWTLRILYSDKSDSYYR